MKILFVKTSSLGDLIQTFPALDYVKKKFPTCEVHWVVEHPFAEILRAHPQIDQVLTIDSKKWRRSPFSKDCWEFIKKLKKTRYDLLFDFQGNVKSGLVDTFARARHKVGFGLKTVHEWPNYFFTRSHINPPKGKNIREDYLGLVQGYFKDTNPFKAEASIFKLDTLQEQKLSSLFPSQEKPILVCPSAAWPNKCLSEEGLIQVLTHLGKGPYWFIWGNPAERALALKVSSHFPKSAVLERLSLPLLQHVMARCSLVVAMDSLPLHLCGTTSTPSLSFFGPSSGWKYRPLGDHHLVIQGACPYGITFEKRCPKLRTCATGLCMKGNLNIDNRVKQEVLARP